MTDNWDDGSDDEWDVDDDALDAKLGLKKDDFEEEEDLALQEKAAQEKANQVALKKKGNALVAKKQAEREREEEAEIARKALEMEADMESKLSIEERRKMERERQEQSDLDLIDDSFGGGRGAAGTGGTQQAGDKVVMKDIKDHMKHARKVAQTMKVSGHFRAQKFLAFESPSRHCLSHILLSFTLFFFARNAETSQVIQQSKDVLDDDALQEIIKTCNVIKNEKVQAAKRKPKGQAQKSKKQDKIEKEKAKKIQDEVFGDSNDYDVYDEIGDAYEDDFF
ncbi:MAG: hypothetical protein SGARI_001600 [Bacillariaceae sp.]